MSDDARTATDRAAESWIDRVAPTWLRPYLRLIRLDRPIGTWLLLLPCWWSVSLATPGWPAVRPFVLFAVGSIIMRGAGCVINDIADRDFDGRVARTADRPIASGAIGVGAALVYLGLLLLAGLAVLVQFNRLVVVLGAGALVLVAVYPYMKRVTYWPQAWLGLTFNWGALLGWAAVRGDVAGPAVALYAAGFFWTLGYDTIYAHQDKADDLVVGVKSSALKLGDATRPWLFAFYAPVVVLMVVAGLSAGVAWPYFVALAAATVHLGWQAKTVDLDRPSDCLAKFKSNRDFGLIVLIGIVAGRVVG